MASACEHALNCTGTMCVAVRLDGLHMSIRVCERATFFASLLRAHDSTLTLVVQICQNLLLPQNCLTQI